MEEAAPAAGRAEERKQRRRLGAQRRGSPWRPCVVQMDKGAEAKKTRGTLALARKRPARGLVSVSPRKITPYSKRALKRPERRPKPSTSRPVQPVQAV